MNIWNILVGAILIAVLAGAFALASQARDNGGCGGGCTGCGQNCPNRKNDGGDTSQKD